MEPIRIVSADEHVIGNVKVLIPAKISIDTPNPDKPEPTGIVF
jgi:hypothetical protein